MRLVQRQPYVRVVQPQVANVVRHIGTKQKPPFRVPRPIDNPLKNALRPGTIVRLRTQKSVVKNVVNLTLVRT